MTTSTQGDPELAAWIDSGAGHWCPWCSMDLGPGEKRDDPDHGLARFITCPGRNCPVRVGEQIHDVGHPGDCWCAK